MDAGWMDWSNPYRLNPDYPGRHRRVRVKSPDGERTISPADMHPWQNAAGLFWKPLDPPELVASQKNVVA